MWDVPTHAIFLKCKCGFDLLLWDLDPNLPCLTVNCHHHTHKPFTTVVGFIQVVTAFPFLNDTSRLVYYLVPFLTVHGCVEFLLSRGFLVVFSVSYEIQLYSPFSHLFSSNLWNSKTLQYFPFHSFFCCSSWGEGICSQYEANTVTCSNEVTFHFQILQNIWKNNWTVSINCFKFLKIPRYLHQSIPFRDICCNFTDDLHCYRDILLTVLQNICKKILNFWLTRVGI
jgi:hypothetical protein